MQTTCNADASIALEINDPVTFIANATLYENVNLVGLDQKAASIIVVGPTTGGRPRAFLVKDCTFLLAIDLTTPSALRPTPVLYLTTQGS